MTYIKICGIKNNQLLAALRDVAIDAFGFVFAPSKRQVTAEQAQTLIAEVRTSFTRPLQCIGVFRNQSQAEIAEIVQIADLDVVQLHGDESPQFCKEIRNTLGKPVMKAFSLQSGSSSIDVIAKAIPYVGGIDMMLIDTHDPIYGGGSGKTFRWEVIDDVKAWCDSVNLHLFVAGGLQPDNILQLLSHYHPYGVDVSSGVETAGEKDLLKIITFVERVRAHDYSS